MAFRVSTHNKRSKKGRKNLSGPVAFRVSTSTSTTSSKNKMLSSEYDMLKADIRDLKNNQTKMEYLAYEQSYAIKVAVGISFVAYAASLVAIVNATRK